MHGIIGPRPLGHRPKRPAKPRRPRETFKRIEVVWTSEDDDILLADLLHLIPSDVKAQKIRFSVERNPLNGYPFVAVSYEHEIPNVKFHEQMRDYVERMTRYERELLEWERRDADWLRNKLEYEEGLLRLQLEIERAFIEQDGPRQDVI